MTPYQFFSLLPGEPGNRSSITQREWEQWDLFVRNLNGQLAAAWNDPARNPADRMLAERIAYTDYFLLVASLFGIPLSPAEAEKMASVFVVTQAQVDAWLNMGLDWPEIRAAAMSSAGIWAMNIGYMLVTDDEGICVDPGGMRFDPPPMIHPLPPVPPPPPIMGSGASAAEVDRIAGWGVAIGAIIFGAVITMALIVTFMRKGG